LPLTNDHAERIVLQQAPSARIVTLLMIAVNTMVFAVRERTLEIGVLKTLDFTPLRIMALIFGETLFVFAVGGAVGLAPDQACDRACRPGPRSGLLPRVLLREPPSPAAVAQLARDLN
jgi:putative ABC transport system permease protein